MHGMARAGRAVFCLATGSRIHRAGADLGRLINRWMTAASGRHRLGRFISLEMIDHDFHDRHHRQSQRQTPDAEYDAKQDLEPEQRRWGNVERMTLDDRCEYV